LELEARHAELAQRDRVQAHAEHVAETNRQHAEQVALDARLDAEARRITELYLKASEQLGSDKAPVRLAGLYALERLAQDNKGQRQTVVNVLCAYLRMPYPQPDDDLIHAQEREVRLTALGILQTHLRPGDDPDQPIDTFWHDIDLDLTGAVLINLDLNNCRIRTARFDKTIFTGSTRFDQATFTGDTSFDQATFTGDAWFDQATFTGLAWFEQTMFTGTAVFNGATFTEGAGFIEALTVHPVPESSSWPPGWRPSDEHEAIAGRDGTWRRLVRSASEPAGPS
jgi:uncharacterized protein YjbI with pentapeptide repeats